MIQLLIGVSARVVLVLVVRVEFYVLADGKETARVDCGIAPFWILALVGCHTRWQEFRAT